MTDTQPYDTNCRSLSLSWLDCQFVLPLPATDQGHSLTGRLDRRTGLGNV